MSGMTMAEMEKFEQIGSEKGWVSPLSEDDMEYFAYLRSVFKRYNITPSKATRSEYDFAVRVAESEFYLHRAKA